jgi:peptide/nickel transport system permease protein
MSTTTSPTTSESSNDSAAEVVAPSQKKKRNRWHSTTIFASLWLGILSLLAILADYLPFIRGYQERVRGAGRFQFGPGTDFLFGSDQLGRDMFARCIYGAQISLRVAASSILLGLLIGGTLGLAAGYLRGWFDRIISIFVDVLLAFPALIISILIVGRFDVLSASSSAFSWLTRTWSITFVLGLLSIAPIARIVRAQTLSLSQREFVLAARSLGAKNSRVIFREILPNLVPAMTSVVFTGIAVLLVAEGGLAFLGYSVKPPSPSWGLLVSENRERIQEAWWATIFPCIMLFLTVLSFNMIGDRVARRFDIREAAL